MSSAACFFTITNTPWSFQHQAERGFLNLWRRKEPFSPSKWKEQGLITSDSQWMLCTSWAPNSHFNLHLYFHCADRERPVLPASSLTKMKYALKCVSKNLSQGIRCPSAAGNHKELFVCLLQCFRKTEQTWEGQKNSSFQSSPPH